MTDFELNINLLNNGWTLVDGVWVMPDRLKKKMTRDKALEVQGILEPKVFNVNT